jgi:hypothetical protein
MNKEKFLIYESIRESGETNMFDVRKVIELSYGELDREDCLDIMKNYSKFEALYLNK